METIAQFAATSEATKDLIARVTAAHEAGTTLVAKVPKQATIVLTAFQRSVFDLAFNEQARIHKAEETMLERMAKLIQGQYGDTAPTYKQFRADREALRILALERGLVDDQWVRKPYNAAIHRLYGALPESDSPAAIAKRAERTTKAVAPKTPAKAGAVKGDTAERSESAEVTIEQFIAKYGMAKVLQAAAHILAERKESKLDATTLQAVAKKYG